VEWSGKVLGKLGTFEFVALFQFDVGVGIFHGCQRGRLEKVFS
jgi:hypothetical protein